MSVGIHDADLSTYKLVPFNLEVMKLSAYYKKQGEIVVLSPQFTPEKNTKFIYRKDYNDGLFPLNLMSPNVEYGGLAFSNNVYEPLPLEVERMRPDTSIYSRAEPLILGAPGREREKKKIFQNMMTAEHCRLSLDGKTIWDEHPRQFKCLAAARNLMLHDYDLDKLSSRLRDCRLLCRGCDLHIFVRIFVLLCRCTFVRLDCCYSNLLIIL